MNIFFSGTSGEELSDLYLYAWELGLKTTYYLRSLAASQVEKSTVGEEGTHLRAKGDGSAGDSQHMVQNATEEGAVPSPLPTLSPMTKEEVDAGKVMVLASVSSVSVERFVSDGHAEGQPVKYNLHIAEDAICEVCQ